MDDMNLFVPITKIDAAQRLVYGVVTAETPDVAGEVCDYASTKPHYQKWSQNFATASGGKSFGNLRAMHGNVAAGKLVDIAFNDQAKRIEICGKVVDDDEWKKVEEGVYTGFSQGGRYLKRWPDPDAPALTRYTAEPLEVSLVDHPCLPEATFAVIKADGSTELRKFKAATPDEELLKIGARHSKADKERIKRAHDALADLDPDCCPGASLAGANVHARPKFSPQAGEGAAAGDDKADGEEGSEKFAKLRDRTLAKALGAINETLDSMNARLKKIEAQPLPLGTSSVRVAEKRDDAIFPQPEALLDRPGALEALAEAAIRRAQSQPLRAIPGFKPRQGSSLAPIHPVQRGDGKAMIPYRSSRETVVPASLEKRLEIVAAIRALAAQDESDRHRRRVEIAALRRDCELLRRSLAGLVQEAIAQARRQCDPRLRSYAIKYSPDQPRVPAGNPDGGQWASGVADAVADASADGSNDGTESHSITQPVRYAAADTGTQADVPAAPTAAPVDASDSPSNADPQVAQASPPLLLFEEPPLVIRPPLPEYPNDPTLPPGPGFKWYGRPGSQPGDPNGSWYNPNTDETLRPDINHPAPTPPHWDYQTPEGQWYRWFPDGRVELKS